MFLCWPFEIALCTASPLWALSYIFLGNCHREDDREIERINVDASPSCLLLYLSGVALVFCSFLQIIMVTLSQGLYNGGTLGGRSCSTYNTFVKKQCAAQRVLMNEQNGFLKQNLFKMSL